MPESSLRTKMGRGGAAGEFDIRVATFNVGGELEAVERPRQLGRMCPNLEDSDRIFAQVFSNFRHL